MATEATELALLPVPFSEQGRSGYLAGEAPASGDPESPDGRFRILNVPSRGRVMAFERSSMLPVGMTLSAADGTWRLNGLDPALRYTVIGFDDLGNSNAAIQDWIEPALIDVVAARPLKLIATLPPIPPGASWPGKVRASEAVGSVTFSVTAGALPTGLSLNPVGVTCLFSGTPTIEGVYSFDLHAEDSIGRADTLPITLSVENRFFYWRVRITANNGSASFTGLTELEMRAAVGGPSVAVNGTASANSQINTDNSGDRAFDHNYINSGWLSASVTGAEWIRYQFLQPIAIKEIAITASHNSPTSTPKSFVLESSPDGSVWTTRMTVTNETGWGALQTRVFTV